jgi:hypothetical protein
MDGTRGNVEALALYAGQGTALIDKLLPAAEIVDQLVSGGATALTRAR